MAHISTKELSHIFKRLSFLLTAGIPLGDRLTIISSQLTSKHKKHIFTEIAQSVSGGSYLYKSLEKHKKLFGSFAISLIKIGEEIGSLNQNLLYISKELEKRNVLKQKIVSALIYPCFIVIGTLLLSGFLLLFMFPKIRPLFTQLKITLPWSTRLLIAISDILKLYGIYILAGLLIFLIIFIILIKKSYKAAYIKDSFILKVPLVNTLIKKYALTQLTRIIGIVLQAGLPIEQSVSIASQATSNLVYKHKLEDIQAKITAGETLSHNLSQSPHLFPSLTTTMLSVAESAGTLSDTMLYISDMYEQEVADAAKNLSSSLEPLLMSIMGLIVGFISISIITPIYTITQNLKH